MNVLKSYPALRSTSCNIFLSVLKVPRLSGDLRFEVFDRYVTSIGEEREEEGSCGDKIEN